MKKAKMHTPNLTQENIARIRELFPNCVTEIKDPDAKPDAEVTVKYAIDFDLLKQELSGQIVEGPVERYQLNWPGKREALLAANAPIAKTLRPVREESVNFDTTENLFIEGDNLDALKLLQETYLGKVKMIYIDPPYNTGSDFIYNDDFAENSDEYLVRSNQKDEEGNRLIANSESNGRFHSDWLSMMYPRLKLARNLLSDDGVIFISIDDGESANLKRLMDEIFGEQNFIDTISVEMSTTSGPKTVNAQQGTIVKNTEFVHVYKKTASFDVMPHIPLLDGIDSFDTHYSIWLNEDGTLGRLSDAMLADEQLGPVIRRYGLLDRDGFSIKNIDKLLVVTDEAKAFINRNLMKIARIDRPPVSAEGRSTEVGRWVTFKADHRTYLLTTLSNGTLQALMPLSLNYRMSDDYKPRFGRTVIRGDLWKGFHQDMGNVAKEGTMPFANGKKPVRLIKQLIKWSNIQANGVILDFFAGSATTAHAVMQLNAEDGGNRKFILVQLPEECDPKSEAYKAGYKTIADIAKERIRRAGKKIQEQLNTKDAPAPKKEKKADGEGLFDAGVVEDGTDPETARNASASRQLDIGFRVLKVDSSCMADVYYTPDQTNQDQLTGLVENIKPDRTEEDLLFQVLLDWGVGFSYPIVRERIEKLDVFFVGGNSLAACFAKDGRITEKLVEQIAERSPMRVVFRDAGFKSDSVRINVEQIFKQKSPKTEIRTI